VGQDAADLHNLIAMYGRLDRQEFVDKLADTKFKNVASSLWTSINTFKNNTLGNIKAKNGNRSSSIITNFNMINEIEGID
jgi:hypothetical protein